MTQTSNEFYQEHAERYSEVVHGFIQSVFTNISHPKLTHDTVVFERMKELIPPAGRGFDAGCGSGARDVYWYNQDGYDMVGVDAVKENIEVARSQHPEIASRVSVADLNLPIPQPDGSFDFVLCNAVIQHISPEVVKQTVLPEFSRILRPNGVLQLMFKVGSGIVTVHDKDYGVDRTFQLYEAQAILDVITKLGLDLIEEESDKLGGVLFFTDTKPTDHCLMFARKRNEPLTA